MMEFSRNDVKAICSHIRHKDKLLQMKRRWLMGLPTISKSRHTKKRFKKSMDNMSLPESFMRDDDVSWETVRASVEMGFKVFRGNREGNHVVRDYLQLFDMNKLDGDTAHLSNILLVVPSILDDMNNNALCLLASIVTRNSIKFEKTRPRMRKVIEEYLPSMLQKSNDEDRVKNLALISQIFKDPRNFQENCVTLMTPFSPCHLAAVQKILDGLDNIPSHILGAIHRKLKGVIHAPQMRRIRSGWNNDRLIKQVRKICTDIISKLDEGDVLPKPLAKAMAVVGLYFKQKGKCADFPMPEFYHFSPEVEALQDDIIKATRCLDKKVTFAELKYLQPLVDPEAKLPKTSFRIALRRCLIEYLFECGEIDIPKSFLRVISFINRHSRRQLHLYISKEKIEEEVECVLNVSSQLRQIIWDSYPDHDIDQEFADAYMDVESDYDSNNDDWERNNNNCCSNLGDRNCLQESIETTPVDTVLPTIGTNLCHSPRLETPSKNLNMNSIVGPEYVESAKPHSSDQDDFRFPSCPLEEFINSTSRRPPYATPNKHENQYLVVQDICDKTSLIAHQLIGRLLEEFLQVDGLDVDPSVLSYLRGGSIPADFEGHVLMMDC